MSGGNGRAVHDSPGDAGVIGKDEVKEKYLDSKCKNCGRKERRHKWVDKETLDKCVALGNVMDAICDKHHGEFKISLSRGYNVDKLKGPVNPCTEEDMLDIST